MSIRVKDWVLYLDCNSVPKEIVIEVSTRCNLSCLHCFRFASRTLKWGDMDLDTFKFVIDNAVKSGIKRLVLTGWGEPTVNSYILDMIEYAKLRGLYLLLNTNGVLLEELAEDLVKLEVDELYVSIDAADAEVYVRLRGGELSTVTRGIIAINELKRARGQRKPAVSSIFTISRLNIDQIDNVIKFALNIGVQNLYLSLYIPYVGGIEQMDCISDSGCLLKLKEEVGGVTVKLVDTPMRLWLPNTEPTSSRECPFVASSALFIRVDAKVSPCLFLAYSWNITVDRIRRRVSEYIIGDARAESLAEIWRRNYKMYFKLLFNYMPSCLDCTLKHWCSYTLSSDVDCWGNSPNCSFCPYYYKFSYCPT